MSAKLVTQKSKTMKNLIDILVGILIVLVLSMVFSTHCTPAEYDSLFGNWGLSGQSGEVLPGEGECEDGDAKVFTLTESKAEVEPEQQKTSIETEQEFPITVNIERPIEDKTPPWEYMLYGAAITLATEVTALLIITIVFWLKTRKRKLKQKQLGI